MKIGIISDTHGYMDDRILFHLRDCNEIWHAGDVGDAVVLDRLNEVAPVIGVYGNIDGSAVRLRLPEFVRYEKDGFRMLLMHIAGAVGKYNETVRKHLEEFRPGVLVCGHSHITKVMFDKRFNCLYVNPGAAGRHGFHQVRTLIKVELTAGRLHRMSVVELGPRSARLS